MNKIISLFILLVTVVTYGAEQEMIYSAGTSKGLSDGNFQTFIIFQSENPLLILERQFAIYRKSGDAASTQKFTKVAVVKPQTNPHVVKSLLERSFYLDDNFANLQNNISGLFDDLLPAKNMTIEKLLAFLIKGAKTNSNVYENLYLLGRMHPGVAMCLGTAFSEKLATGIYTYEIRDAANLTVVGRVTIDTANPVVLPEPGAIREVIPVEKATDGTPEESLIPSAKGHLNASLRWSTPDDLRRLSLLHFGYNVYRVPKAIAETNGWDNTQPVAGDLADAVALDKAVKVNNTPILIDKVLNDSEASDISDHETIFLIDAKREGDNPFKDGDKFYYYVCGIDPLGRDGDYSIGSLITITDSLPPSSPKRVKVENTFTYDDANDEKHHSLKIIWNAPAVKDGETITRYYIYRWSNIKQMYTYATNPASNRIGVVNASDAETYEFVDDGSMTSFLDDEQNNLIDEEADPDIPTGPGDFNKTFWYTVRAVDDSANGGNVSGNSAPGFGVLRKRQFNASATTTVTVFDSSIDVHSPPAISDEDLGFTNGDQSLYYRFAVTVNSHTNCKAKFWIDNSELTSPFPLGEKILQAGSNTFTIEDRLTIDIYTNMASSGMNWLYCQVSGDDTEDTEAVNFITLAQDASFSHTQERLIIEYDADLILSRQTVNDEDPVHYSLDMDNETIHPIEFTLSFPEGTKEYKLYRCLDDGPYMLIAQGLVEESNNARGSIDDIIEEDAKLILHDGKVSYYTQIFDTHGNPGPMTLIESIEVHGKTPMLPPRVLPIVPSGTPDNPKIRLRWFAPAHGIEKFIISTYVVGTETPEDFSPYLHQKSKQDIDGKYAQYITGRIGDEFRQIPDSDTLIIKDNSYFELELPVIAGYEHLFKLSSVSLYGRYSSQSEYVSYTWTQTGGERTGGVNGGDDGSGTVDDPSLLPWPLRKIPESTTRDSDTKIYPDLWADYVDQTQFKGMLLRIGEGSGQEKPYEPPYLDHNVDPKDKLFNNPEMFGSIAPFVVYRRQKANNTFTNVRDTTYQVSPLIENIPYEYDQPNNRTWIKDEFFVVMRDVNYDPLDQSGIYLKDTTPVIQGATYEYYVVLFDDKTGEPVHTIVLPEVTVPKEDF